MATTNGMAAYGKHKCMKITKTTRKFYEEYIEDIRFFELYRRLKINKKTGLKILLERCLYESCTIDGKIKTYQSLASEIGVTRERIRQREAKILESLQNNYYK